MAMAVVFRFLIILLAMLIAGICGFLLARYRANQQNSDQISMMSAEVMKMRRRASTAEAKEVTAQSRLSRARRRNRRA